MCWGLPVLRGARAAPFAAPLRLVVLPLLVMLVVLPLALLSVGVVGEEVLMVAASIT